MEGVLDRLVEQQFLDDGRFVDMFIRSRAERGQGPVRISHELREKGVDSEVIETALAAAEADWIELARATLARKFPDPAADFPERARRMRFLEYRGYTRKQIAAALKGGDTE